MMGRAIKNDFIYIEKKVEEVLLKRFALDKVISLKTSFLILILSILSFTVFAIYWYTVFSKRITFLPASLWVILVITTIGFCWAIMWKLVGELIPRFVWIGFLGWFFISSSIIPDLFVPGNWLPNKEETPIQKKIPSISFPITRFLGVSEITDADLSKKEIDFIQKNFLIAFFSPRVIHNNNIDNKTRIVLFSLFAIILLFFLDIFLLVSTNRKETPYRLSYFKYPWYIRERNLKLDTLIITISSLIFFMNTQNFFVLTSFLLFIGNIFLFSWIIKTAGQNHKLYSRATYFVIMTTILSSITGELFFTLFLPVFTLGKIGMHYCFNLFDFIVVLWIIISGSVLTVFVAMVTQIIWSGERMTERMGSKL